MKVTLSTIGKFHTFDLARELHARGVLAGIYSGYPRFKLRNEGLSEQLIHTFPWVHGSYMAFPWKHRLGRTTVQAWENFDAITFSRWLQMQVDRCDVYVGLSGSALQAGRKAQARGARYVCDRGSAHIREQEQLLREEHALWDMPFVGLDRRNMAREEAEYDAADCITVPSRFVLQSFVRQGVTASKLRLLPYGVNLSRFHPTATPAADRFDVLFVGGMSLRKGVQYLVQAYTRLQHPAKSLTFVGAPSQELIDLLQARGLWCADTRVLGHMPQPQLKDIMSRSHVLVLPSIEEGLAMVQAQAMACGCPVLASDHTGSADLYTDGCEGYIVPIRNVDALTERLQRMADNPDMRRQMAQRALQTVQGLGGWNRYGDSAVAIYRELLQR